MVEPISDRQEKDPQQVLQYYFAWRLAVDLKPLAKLIGKAARGKPGKKVVHNLRVYSRKLRVTLRNFRFLLPETQYQSLNETLRNFADQLSVVRELDVLHQQFKKNLKKTYTEAADHGFFILEKTCAFAAHEKRAQISSAAITFSGSQCYTFLNDYVSIHYDLHQLSSVCQHDRVLVKAQTIMQRQLKKVAENATALDADHPGDDFHQLRIALKNFRYTISDFACLREDEFAPQLERMELLQDLMGNIHDHQIWITQSREILAVVGEDFSETGYEWESAAFALNLMTRDWQHQIESDYSDLKKIWGILDRDRFWSGFHIIESESEQGRDPIAGEGENQHLKDLSESTPE